MRIKVVHLLPSFRSGGAERMAVQLMRALDRSRYEVLALSMFGACGSDLESMLAAADIPVTFLGKQLGLDIRMLSRIDNVIRDYQPDIVQTHLGVLPYSLGSLLTRRVKGTVHTLHSIAEQEAGPIGRLVQGLAFRCGVTPVAIANEVSISIRRVYGIRDAVTIFNGIPLNAYRHPALSRAEWRLREGFSPDSVLVACVARLSLPKDHLLLLEAFTPIAARNPDVQLLLVGDGPERARLEERVKVLSLESRVRFLGQRTDIPDILGAVDVCALPSRWEGNPLAVMEAMAAGKPIIASRVGGIPELVESGKSGLLVPLGDIQGWANAIEQLVSGTETRSALGTYAATVAERRFNITAMVNSYQELYERLLSAKR